MKNKNTTIDDKKNMKSEEVQTTDNGFSETQLEVEIENVKSQLARALADYQNQSKRFQEERNAIVAYASERVLINFIPVLDTLVKAQEHLQDKGLEMAISQFKKTLTEEGLEEICPKSNNSFDHETMEVVESVEGGEKDTVNECVLSGWKFKDGKIVRYAKVKVFGGK